MNEQVIELLITVAGEVRVQTKGFTGNSCREASRLIEQALGCVLSDTPTAEMYQSVPQTQVVRQGNG